jgi:phosphoenolpyruvate carboxykinase (ATP)
MKDPVARTDSPYTDPSVKGPRSQLLAHRQSPAAANSKSSETSHLSIRPIPLGVLVADLVLL